LEPAEVQSQLTVKTLCKFVVAQESATHASHRLRLVFEFGDRFRYARDLMVVIKTIKDVTEMMIMT
jgi:hypothetical protein